MDSTIKRLKAYLIKVYRERFYWTKHLFDYGKLIAAKKKLGTIDPHLETAISSDEHFKLTVVTVVRNENRYIEEWLKFHLSQGVEHFYVYINEIDPEREDALRRLLTPYVERKEVSLIDWPNLEGVRYGQKQQGWVASLQELAFLHFRLNYADQSEYYCKLDVDEYVFSKRFQSLTEELTFRGTRVIHGYTFGAGGKMVYSPEPVTERFLFREAKPTSRKSISRTADCYEWFNPHESQIYPWKNIFKNRKVRLYDQDIRLNHYRLKSRAEFLERRKNPRFGINHGKDSEALFEKWDQIFTDVEDHTILKVTEETSGEV